AAAPDDDGPSDVGEPGDGEPEVHPAFTIRRGEVRRKIRRRRRRITLSLLGVVLGALVAGGVLVSPLTDVDAVEVLGASELTPDAVVEASGVQQGQAMFSVDA